MPYYLKSHKIDKHNKSFEKEYIEKEHIETQNKNINVTIKTLMGKNYNLTVNNNMSYMNLFKLISHETDIPQITFYLVNNHRKLPKYEEIIDWMELKDFNFNTDITLHLVLRLGFKQDPFVYNKEDWF